MREITKRLKQTIKSFICKKCKIVFNSDEYNIYSYNDMDIYVDVCPKCDSNKYVSLDEEY
jgi:RNase P subunit RPR2